jgi:hypothetical protein
MPNVTAKTGRTNDQTTDVNEVSGVDNSVRPALDACYRKIGISAVAAAARYQGVAKNQAYAPAPNEWRHQFAEDPA